ncbi:MAG: extracellular solute-binding protein [Oscillospiraceae bacterium]|nr:extracellular solute-binding protein [Oscillospiraceae bacterium]
MKRKLHGKNYTIRAASAALLAVTLSGCGATESDPAETTSTAAPGETVAINTEVLNDEQQAAVSEAANSMLTDEELENKTVKWLAHYDLNPDPRGGSKSVSLEMFESKYGGKIEYFPTTWEGRWTDLSTYVLGGEGIDFFPFDTTCIPRGIASGMFEPVDEYVDLDSPLWQETAKFMKLFNFGGKHYELCTGVSPEAVVIYNKQTIEEMGFDDPYEMYLEGSWNWDTMRKMLTDFVDPENGRYGLDGYHYQKAIGTSAGATCVQLEGGRLSLNLDDERLEKVMFMANDMYNEGLFLDRAMFDWSEQAQMMGDGGELFYFCGIWTLESDPSIWSTKISPENAAVVPVPCSSEFAPAYSVIPDGFMLCKGSANPKGAVRYAECCIAASMDESTVAITNEKRRNDYGWTDELISQNDECIRIAEEYPFYDLSYGISQDFTSAITDSVQYNTFSGNSFASAKEEVKDVAQILLDEFNSQLDTAVSGQ